MVPRSCRSALATSRSVRFCICSVDGALTRMSSRTGSVSVAAAAAGASDGLLAEIEQASGRR